MVINSKKLEAKQPIKNAQDDLVLVHHLSPSKDNPDVNI